jgi:hypothetical protein
MSAYDTQVTSDGGLADAFASYGKALEEFAKVFTAVVDQNIEANKVIVDTVRLQEEVLLGHVEPSDRA